MPSQALTEARAALRAVKRNAAQSTREFWQRMVQRFRDMDPDERAALYQEIEDYASMLTHGHSTLVTAALRHLREMYRSITGQQPN